MNKIYKVIYSETRKAWVVVSELVTGHGKSSGRRARRLAAVLVGSLLLLGGNAWAYRAPIGNDDSNDDAKDGGNFYNTAVGIQSESTGFGSAALGFQSKATAQDTSALGVAAEATSRDATAIGAHAISNTQGSSAIGAYSKALAADSTALGYNSSVFVNGGIALGVNSVANRGVESTNGYAYNSSISSVKGIWSPTAAVLSIGKIDSSNPNDNITRRITAVAAGVQDSDAVNVAQLKAVQAGAATHYFHVNSSNSNNYNNDRATGNDAIAIGPVSGAAGNQSIAIGVGANITGSYGNGQNDIAIGSGASIGYSDGSPSVAIGAAALGIGQSSVALGNDAQAGNWQTHSKNSIAVGSAAHNYGEDGTALGYNSLIVSGKNNIAVGANSKVGPGFNNIAVGTFSTAGSFSNYRTEDARHGDLLNNMGRVFDNPGAERQRLMDAGLSQAMAEAYMDFKVWGRWNSWYEGDFPSDDYNTALGFGARAEGAGQTALGSWAWATGRHSTAIGLDSKAETSGALAIGLGASVLDTEWSHHVPDEHYPNDPQKEWDLPATNSIAIGSGAVATARDTTTVGRQSQALMPTATAYGNNSHANGQVSIAIGNKATAGYESDIFNLEIKKDANGKPVIDSDGKYVYEISGIKDAMAGDSSIAMGNRATAVQRNDVAIGTSSYTNGRDSVTVGVQARATGRNSIAIGGGEAMYRILNANNDLEPGNPHTENERYYGVATINQAAGDYSTAAGYNNKTVGEASTALGKENAVTGTGSLAAGSGNKIGTVKYVALTSKVVLPDGTVTNVSLVPDDYPDDPDGEAQFLKDAADGKITGLVAEQQDDTVTGYAVGTDNTITGNAGTNAGTFGANNTVSGDNSYAIGNRNSIDTDSANSFVVGSNVKTTAPRTVVFGYHDENNSHTFGQDSVSLGTNAVAKLKDSVALGSNSIADRDAGVTGANPLGVELTDEQRNSPTWTSTAAAVSVGGGTNADGKTITRQIINVAAGSADTDAVNVAQLKGFAPHYYSVNIDDPKDPDGKDSNFVNDGATRPGAIAAGYYTSATANSASAFGNKTLASGVNSVAAGHHARAADENSSAFGVESTAVGKNSSSVGYSSSAYGEGTIAVGHEATAGLLVEIKTPEENGTDAMYTSQVLKVEKETGEEGKKDVYIFRTLKELDEKGTPKIVAYNTTNRTYHNATRNDDGSVTSASIGEALTQNEVDGLDAKLGMGGISMGSYSHAEGNRSMAIGRASGAYGKNSAAMGIDSNALGEGGLAIGHGASTGVVVKVDDKSGEDGFWTTEVERDANGNPVANTAAGGIAIGSYAHTEGIRALAVGRVSGAYGTDSTAIGLRSNAYGEGSIAFGHGVVAGILEDKYEVDEMHATATTDNHDLDAVDKTRIVGAIAMGSYAQATGRGSLSMGRFSKAGSAYSTAMGIRAKVAEGAENAIAIGREVTVGKGGENSVAIGQKSTVTGSNSIAIGSGHTVSGNNSGAIGDPNIVSGDNSYVIGNNSSVDVDDAFVLGNNASVKANGGVAIGTGSVSSRGSETTNGYDMTTGKAHELAKDEEASVWAPTSAAVAVGDPENKITRRITGVAAGSEDTDAVNVAQLKLLADSVGPGGGGDKIDTDNRAVGLRQDNGKQKITSPFIHIDGVKEGTEAAAEDDYSNYAYARAAYAIAIGSEANAYGEQSIAIGKGATAGDKTDESKGKGAVAIGGQSVSTGEFSVAMQNGKATGDYSMAFGNKTEADGQSATAFGEGSTASGNYAVAFGNKSHADAENSLAALGGTVQEDGQGPATGSAAIGEGAKASVAGTVALGSGSVANQKSGKDLGNSGYDIVNAINDVNDGYSEDEEYIWRSTENAISIGSLDGKITRRIIGVAAGHDDTDAVNVAQLKQVAKALKDSGGGSGSWNLAVNVDGTKGDPTPVKNDNTVRLNVDQPEGTELLKLTNEVNGDGERVVTWVVSDAPKFDSLTVGSNGGTFTSKGPAVFEGPVTMKDNLNMDGNRITHLGWAKNDDEAVPLGQLKDYVNNTGNNFNYINNKIDKGLRHVGSRAAALAALHPLDYDPDKPTSIMAGFGHYKGDSTVALGVAHHFNDDTLVTVGSTIGHDTMVNVGLSLRLGRNTNMTEKRWKVQRYTAVDYDAKLKVMEAKYRDLKEDKDAEISALRRELQSLREDMRILRGTKGARK